VGNGLAGAAYSAATLGVSNTANALANLPGLTLQAESAIARAETIGPWLKGGLAVLVPIGLGLGVAATAVGSVGFGLWSGFANGVENGMPEVRNKTNQAKEFFSDEVIGRTKEGIKEFGDEKLQPGDQPFDVSPVKAGVGIVAGLANSVNGAARFGGITAKHTPRVFLEVNKDIIEANDTSMPLKMAGHVLTVPAAVLATPTATVGGALIGLGLGVTDGYKKGFGEAFRTTGDWAQQYDKMIQDNI
jgi:uncharacterized membrane protein YedE/YeeE